MMLVQDVLHVEDCSQEWETEAVLEDCHVKEIIRELVMVVVRLANRVLEVNLEKVSTVALASAHVMERDLAWGQDLAQE